VALVFAGDTGAAASAVAERASIEEATGISATPYGALILSAWQGDDPIRTKRLAEANLQAARVRGEGSGVAISGYARAVLSNSLGEYEKARTAAISAAADPTELVAHNWGLTELVEASARTGHIDEARRALSAITRKAQAGRTDWGLGIEARSQALVAPDADAEQHYREAIRLLARARVRAELARSHLVYGEWLRRAGRRVDARAQLVSAHDLFSSMGMVAFAERAGRALAATGATVRRRTDATRNELTAQELQIARLARDGHSNPEIGAQLFISARTVEWHMRNILSKLDVSSRRHLREKLRDQ
jgi:DNA-binding NarL/FixJ family response regulator